jgi:hypothetical protein
MLYRPDSSNELLFPIGVVITCSFHVELRSENLPEKVYRSCYVFGDHLG